MTHEKFNDSRSTKRLEIDLINEMSIRFFTHFLFYLIIGFV